MHFGAAMRVNLMSTPSYDCTKCKKIFSHENYKQSVYCPSCGERLWRRSLSPPPFKVDGFFADFLGLKSFEVAEGIIFNDVPLWLASRKKAYIKYQEKFSAAKLADGDKWLTDFKNFLYFKNNQSWNLNRGGSEALSNPEQLKHLLTLIQYDSTRLDERIREALQGKSRCPGINKNILTGLLHTFYPDKYGVWNKQTDDGLKKIGRTPATTVDEGRHYLNINAALTKLAAELHTNLTTIDAFMWHLSK